MTDTIQKKRRAIVYIDGFNLYFALREKNWYGFMWLDVKKLAQNLVRPDQELVAVKYFTSRIKNDADKIKRQNAYLDALEAMQCAEIHCGDYQDNVLICHGCGKKIRDNQEKQTDVNIATHMIVDAMGDAVDDLILITADSDQCPAIKAVKAMKKHVLAILPPGRGHYIEVKLAAGSHLELTAKKFKNALLPEQVTNKDGFVIVRPDKYRPT